MKRSSKILFALLLMTVLLLCIGSVGAYMRKQTEVVENVFIPAEVSCVVDETFNGTNKTKIAIQNTSNIDAYLRLRLVTYWVNSNGEIIFEKSQSLSEIDYDSNCWIKSGDTYYYKYPVQTNKFTENLLKEDIQLGVDSNGNRQVVEVFAEAIQSKPKEAVISAWPVILDSDDNIKAFQ